MAHKFTFEDDRITLASTQHLLRFDLWMSGCFLWTIAPRTEAFFKTRLRRAGAREETVDQALNECFCTVLGGANAYLDRYCQFENNQRHKVAGRKTPLLIAFCYNQLRENRKYDFYLMSTEREEMHAVEPGIASSSILRAYLAKLPDSYSLSIADGSKQDGVLSSVRITDGKGKSFTRDVPRANIKDVRLVGELERRMDESASQTPSPARAWSAIGKRAEFKEIFHHIPKSVQDTMQGSVSGIDAMAVLHNATRHPADAPVLMEIYEELQQSLAQGIFEKFQNSINATRCDEQTEPEGLSIPEDLMPRSALLGRVCDIEDRDQVGVEFEIPGGERFIETFDRNRLKSVNADYYGAPVKYLIYEKGSWRASKFLLRPASSIVQRTL